MSLLEDAQRIPQNAKPLKNEVTLEEIDLYMAFFAGKVTSIQVAKVLFPGALSNRGISRVMSRAITVMKTAIGIGRVGFTTTKAPY